MSVKSARVPAELGSEGRRLWREIAGQVARDGLELDARELQLLRSACCEADMLAKVTAALAGEPMTVRGAQGQLVAHPLLGEARRSRTTIASLLKQRQLVDPLVAAKTGSGSRTTSWQAREAAKGLHHATGGP